MPRDTSEELVIRLRSLAEDLERLRFEYPTAQQLAEAPLLRNWVVVPDITTVLEGTVEGHPLLGRRDIRTSMLWRIDPQRGWARTLSRFYRLDPAGERRSYE